jgi:uncharacterized membrane protein YfcA
LDGLTLIAAVAIAAIAGLVRGITGFGGAMVMTPPLALLLGPRLAVPVVLLLESVVALPMLVQTRDRVRWRVIGTIIVAACITVPLGTLILVTADPRIIRRAIAVTVIVFALVLLRGWRYAGRPRVATSIGLGAISGAMLGATSIGAPPVILYLLSGPDPVETTRANLTLYVTVISLAGIVMLFYYGVLDARAGWTSLWLAPAYYAGLVAGTRLFPRFSDTRFRQLTLMLLIGVSTGILLA